MTWQTWRAAMTEALYGPDGFYRRPDGPAAHFRTSVHVSSLFGEALLRLAWRTFHRVDEPAEFALVDVGAGRGELLRLWAEHAPPRWRLIGVDIVERPGDLPGRVEWLQDLEALEPVPYGLLVANEWLDNVPIDVMSQGRLVEVDATGAERVGAPAGERDLEWHRRWPASPDDRVEIGWPRDDAWAAAVAKVGVGAAVAIDYYLSGGRPLGTLTGFRDGREVPPVPDGSCDLTAHVVMESCVAAAGAAAMVLSQRDALAILGVSARLPPRELASSDPAGYLRALASATEARELTDPSGLGRFNWIVQTPALDPADLMSRQEGSIG